jgi:immune inhibitor A
MLAELDVWDRYDLDLDGNFNESDGFIDHFQIVHAGGDEADGDPIYAGDAIWSHRSYSNLAYAPSCFDPEMACITGTPIGGTINPNGTVNETANYTGFYIGDYTMQPENGGRSVFYHEYAHDLGLPDDYNNQLGGDNNNEHWTLMAQSRLGAADDAGIGERGGDLGAWNKLQLGWLDYVVVGHDQHKTIQLGPQEYNSNLPQAAIVVLPDKPVTTEVGAPFAGSGQWYSGHTDATTHALTTTVTVPASDPSLTFKARYDIELLEDGVNAYDYAYVAVDGTPIVGTVDGKQTLTRVGGTTSPIQPGWAGFTEMDEWVDGVFDLSDYAGSEVELSFVYQSDPAVSGNLDVETPDGLFLDEIAVGGTVVGDGESTDGWTVSPDGSWEAVGASTTVDYPHFYIAGYRSHVGYDRYLETGPYYFGYNPTFPDKVDHYSYQEGLLISYWDTSFANNDTMLHPGEGRNLYIDAHPQPFARSDGALWRARIQVYDAPFGKRTTDTVTLHHDGAEETFGGLAGNPVFRDTDQYWFGALPNHGVKLPGYGVTIEVLNDSAGRLKIKVN